MYVGAGQRFADFFQHGAASCAVVSGDTNLNELVRLEIEVDFLEYGFSQTPVADKYDGAQGVGSSTQGATLLRCNVEFWHGGIVREWPRKNFLKIGCTSILMTHMSNRRNRKVTEREQRSN